MTSTPPSVSPDFASRYSLFMFFTHLFACPCGSIIKGHRRALATMMPFSTETESEGKPAMVHARICTGSASVVWMSAPGVCGSRSSAIFADHSCNSSARNEGVNGPLYATTPEETTTSPTTFTSFSPSASTVFSHLVLSPPKPPMSFPARSSCAWQRDTSALSSSCFALPASNLSLSSARFASTPASVAFASASSPMVTSNDACASFSAARFGSMASETL